MDPIDRAQARDLERTADALDAHRLAREAERQRPRVSHCRDCGEAISQGRLKALPRAQQCIFCAEQREHAMRRGVAR